MSYMSRFYSKINVCVFLYDSDILNLVLEYLFFSKFMLYNGLHNSKFSAPSFPPFFQIPSQLASS